MIVELIYEWRREAQLGRARHPRVLYVTDLVRCPLKRRFEMLFPELASQDLMGPASVAGSLLHLGIEGVVAEYAVRRGYSVEAEVEVAFFPPCTIGTRISIPASLSLKYLSSNA